MNKILLSSADIEFILQWRDEHKDAIRLGMIPLKSVQIVCTDTGYILTAINNGQELAITTTQNGKKLGKLVFRLLENGFCALIKNTTNFSEEEKQSVLTVYSSTMAILVFGSATVEGSDKEPKEITKKNTTKTNKSQKKKSSGVTYILRNSYDIKREAQQHRKSPDHSFSVRGHYRHYKSGKVIWIEEFTKGTGKKKNTIHKLKPSTF